MPPVEILIWVGLVTLAWVGIVAAVWALLTAREEPPPEVSRPSAND